MAKPVTQVYLTLSSSKIAREDRFSIVDLFFPDTALRVPEHVSASKYKAQLAAILWQQLLESGFRLNSALEAQYKRQLTCIWCGGGLITIGTGTAELPGWEIRCTDCNYLVDED